MHYTLDLVSLNGIENNLCVRVYMHICMCTRAAQKASVHYVNYLYGMQ